MITEYLIELEKYKVALRNFKESGKTVIEHISTFDVITPDLKITYGVVYDIKDSEKTPVFREIKDK